MNNNHIKTHQELIKSQIAQSIGGSALQAEDLEKSASDFFEKGGNKYPVGSIKEYGGKKYIKTVDGWKYHGKGGTKLKESETKGIDKKTLKEQRYAPDESVVKTIKQHFGDDYELIAFKGSEASFDRWGSSNPIKKALNLLKEKGLIKEVPKTLGDQLILKDGSEIVYDEFDDIDMKYDHEAMAKNGFLLGASGNYDGTVVVAFK